jgi:catechol 2,3-dioxygenase
MITTPMAAGYHHHLGINTWNGVGAPPAPANAVGLRYFTVKLTDQVSLEELQSRIKLAGFDFQQEEDGKLIKDPSGNGFLFSALG